MKPLRYLFLLFFFSSTLFSADEPVPQEQGVAVPNVATENVSVAEGNAVNSQPLPTEPVVAEAANNENNADAVNAEGNAQQATATQVVQGEPNNEAKAEPKENYDGDVVKAFPFQGDDSEIQRTIDSQYSYNLDIKNPVFFISEGLNSLSYIYSNNLCNAINIADKTINCVVYPVENKADIPSYMRRGNKADNFDTEKGGVNGDFLLARVDDLIAYTKGEGYLAGAPILDVVAFLNGDYFFMFSHKAKNNFSLEQLLFNKEPNAVVNIGFLNPQSGKIFEGILKPLFPKNRFAFRKLEGADIENVICRPSNVDLVIYLGGEYPAAVKAVMAKCPESIVPITLAAATTKVILEKYPVFSVANVISYYDPTVSANFLDTYLSVEKAYKQKIADQEATLKARSEPKGNAKAPLQRRNLDQKVVNNDPKNQTTRKTRAELNAQKMQEEAQAVTAKNETSSVANNKEKQKEKVKENDKIKELEAKEILASKNVTFKEEMIANLPGSTGKLNTQLVGVFPNIKTTLAPVEKRKLYLSGNAEIRTFGIRYVLLTSRYTRKGSVLKIFDGIIKDYLTTREKLLTPDMKRFSVKDVVVGTGLSTADYSYHYAVIQYPKIMLERKAPRTNEQNLAIRAILTGINSKNIQQYAGPVFPDNSQLNYVYNRLRELNKKKQELVAIKVFQRDISNIQVALDSLKAGKKIPDSVIESTGLYTVDSSVQDNSVLSQDALE